MTEEAEPTTRAEIVRHVPPSAAVAATSLIEMGDAEFTRMKGVATALAVSGVFKDAGGKEKAGVAFAKMVIGRELGLGIAQSMTGLHLVEGTIQMHYSTMLACVRARGWKYRIVEQTAERCQIDWFEPGADPRTDDPTGSTEFTIEDAITAKIVVRKPDGSLQTPKGRESMYAKVPKNMLLARAVSNGVKAWVPEALGGMPVYATGEVEPSYEEVVDGMPGGPTSSPDASLDDVLAKVDDPEVREHLAEVYAEAQAVRPGQLSAAVIEMNVAGQSTEAVAAYVDREAAMNERALTDSKPVVDAEVVGDGSEPGDAAGEAEGAFPAEPPGDVDVEKLRGELSDLIDRVAEIESSPDSSIDPDREISELGVRIDEIEEKLRGAGATVPGQEAMPI